MMKEDSAKYSSKRYILYKLLKKSFILQQDSSDCGVACLLSLIKFYNGHSNLEKLRKLSGTDKQGTTLLGLFQASQKLGFDVEGLQANTIEELKNLENPVILHCVKKGNHQHYIIFYKFDNGKFIIGDPAEGIQDYTQEQLEDIWVNKNLLKLTPNNQFITQKENTKLKKTWIIQLLEADYGILGVSAFLGVILTILGLSVAIFSQKLIDDFLPNADKNKLIFGLVLLSFVLLIRVGLGYLRGFFLIKQSLMFNQRLMSQFLQKLFQLPKTFFDNRKIGDLVARMNDTRRIQSAIAYLASSLVIDILLVLIFSIFLPYII